MQPSGGGRKSLTFASRLAVVDHGTKKNFAALDMLRGIAAIAVVFLHLNHAAFDFLPSSGLAVDLFFVLSGFVVAHAYEAKLRSTMSFRYFAEIRLVRLYPMYLAGTFAGFAAVVIFTVSGVDWSKLAWTLGFALLFLPTPQGLAWGGLHIYPLNFPAWSLAWELAINFIYALIARQLTHGLLVAILLFGAALLVGAGYHYGDLTGGSLFANMWAGPMRVVYSFFAGVGVYRLWQQDRFSRLQVSLPVSVVILVLVFAIRPAAAGLYDVLVTLFLFPILVLATSRAKADRFLSLSALLGNVSYPVYTLHAPLLTIELPFYKYIGTPVSAIGIAPEISFVAMIVVAAYLAEA